MPSPTTALQVITDALFLSRSVGTDETLTANEVSDSLRALNDQIENWSTQKLAVYGQANQTFNTVANQATYTIGVGGNWNTARPIRISEPAYSVLPTGSATPVTFPCLPITQAEYNLIGVKGQTQAWPDFYLYVNEYPLGLITLWPVPSQVTAVTFSIDRIITQIANQAAVMSFPPGYIEAFKYNLAVRLSPIFGRPVDPNIQALAVSTLADIKRANRVTPVMQYDPAITGTYGDWQVWP